MVKQMGTSYVVVVVVAAFSFQGHPPTAPVSRLPTPASLLSPPYHCDTVVVLVSAVGSQMLIAHCSLLALSRLGRVIVLCCCCCVYLILLFSLGLSSFIIYHSLGLFLSSFNRIIFFIRKSPLIHCLCTDVHRITRVAFFLQTIAQHWAHWARARGRTGTTDASGRLFDCTRAKKNK